MLANQAFKVQYLDSYIKTNVTNYYQETLKQQADMKKERRESKITKGSKAL